MVPRSFLETSHLLGPGVSGRSMYFESDQRKCPTAAASSLPTLGNTFLGSSGIKKRGNPFATKKGVVPPVKQNSVFMKFMWETCIFLGLGIFGPLWATWDLWGFDDCLYPTRWGSIFTASSEDPWGLQLSFGRDVRWNARSMSDLRQLGTTRRQYFSCVFF